MKVMAILAAAALAAPTPATSDLRRDVEAVHATGAVGVLSEVITPSGRQRARAGAGDLAAGSPVPFDARFRVGSVTKSFVATVVLQLAGEGRLALDDTVERWLPGLVRGNGNDGSKITVRQLLQHTSGLYDYNADLLQGQRTEEGWRNERFRSFRPERLIAMATAHAPHFPPGTSWSYSATNYAVAGMLIRAVTGQTWEQQVRRRVIEPLGLRDTSTPGESPFLPDPKAHGYTRFAPGAGLVDVTVQNQTHGNAAGALTSSPRDLARYFRALLGGELLAPAQLAEMKKTVPAKGWEAFHPGARYGLGLVWRPLGCGGGYWSHSGTNLGYRNWDGVTADGKRSVAVSATITRSAEEVQADLTTMKAMDRLVENALCAKR
ncbi:serine hydrolase domain-containing protein [Nonomuraea sp. NPDC050394]|uniref:serine hydrolase domain-containing protein n=1 Tax=Nonomuraea sp. NPDC050394 TaxID=3364363 RepID=UPI0037953E29